MEEERLAHKFDHMSMEYDSSGGLSPELVNAFHQISAKLAGNNPKTARKFPPELWLLPAEP
ncbi:MAG: hypothetical protein ACLR0U_08970 [Enterocloster clostridioformis]